MTIVFKVSDNVKEKMIDYYEDLQKDKTPPYAIFQATEQDTTITLYESGKVMFQGISADVDANIWIALEKKLNNRIIELEDGKEKNPKSKTSIKYNDFNTIGSDEVGTGDYFGPIVVCATFVSKENQKFLKKLKVNDSKKLTDATIKELAPKIMAKIPYSVFTLSNDKYNELDHDLINMNKTKAILHNKVLSNMIKKTPNYDLIVIDQFTTPQSYFKFLSDVPQKVTNISFTPKAESQCLSVACASILSRYFFLLKMNEINKIIGKVVPLGANDQVDEFAKEIIKEKGEDFLKHYVKLNFANSKKIGLIAEEQSS